MLKKWMILSLLTFVLWIPSFAAEDIRIEIDGKPLVLEVAPVIEEGRTLVPFRAIFEALGLKIDWVSEGRIATAYNADMNVSVKIDAAYGNINGELIQLDTPGKIVDGRTLVPLRFISEAFGNTVTWNPEMRLISITSHFEPYAYTQDLPTVDSFDKLKLILEYSGKYTSYVYPIRDDLEVPVFEDKGESSVDAPVAIPEAAPSGEGDGDHSSTNVQVEGVDEADIVKTDGDILYHLRAQDLKITDISTGTMKTLATIKFESLSGATEFYLYDQKLIVIGNQQIYYPMYEKFAPDLMPWPQMTPKTQVYFYDVSTPAKPVLIRTFEGEGAYMTSRLSDGNLYMVMNKWLNTYGLTVDNVLPSFTDVSYESGKATSKASKIDFNTLKYFPDSVESNIMITLGFDLDHMNEAPYKGAYLGNSTNLYANSKDMVIALDRYHYDFRVQGDLMMPMFQNTTELYKFRLVNGAILFDAKGTVPGRVLNQFSMDAYEDVFRIATTSGETWDDTSRNNLYVLDAEMSMVGKLEGLAPGERIYSARFVGERAYLVTFKQVDPFYVLDLKDPTKPAVLGYLKIPGFSDYLHPYDANTVIGFGRDTIETANGPIQGGIKIAMFDVTDVTKPVEKSKIVLGGSGSYSEVLNNHKALLFSKDKNIFALPVLLYDSSSQNYRFTFQGAYVYHISPNTGFTLLGTSTHLTQAEVDDSVLKWYDTTKNVSRIIWSDSTLYTISDYGVKSHNIANMIQNGFMVYE